VFSGRVYLISPGILVVNLNTISDTKVRHSLMYRGESGYRCLPLWESLVVASPLVLVPRFPRCSAGTWYTQVE
jgi:hypothetical protein